MILTGKCKEDFEKWIENKKFSILHDVGDIQMNIVPLGDMFEQLHFSMQYGVYVDFFLSKNILIDTEFILEPKMNGFTIKGIGFYVNGIKSKHRRPKNYLDVIRKEAIEKANEIYNNN